MPWLDLPRTDEPEEIDDPHQPFPDIVQSMGEVARTNRLFGGTHAILRHVAALLRDVPPGTHIRILDIATGSGDIPRALQDWSKRRGLTLTIVGVDNMPAMLRMAQQACASQSDMLFIQADAACLPFPPKSFDIALCALAFHHFGFELSARVLRAMDTLSTRGFVVSDLRRDRLTLLGVQAILTAMRTHRFTRHDGPASVRRAFTPSEYRKMIALSGAQHVSVSAHLYFRIALVQDKRQKRINWV